MIDTGTAEAIVAPPSERQARRPGLSRIFKWVFIATLAVLVLGPLLSLLLKAGQDGGFVRLAAYDGFGQILLNTVVLSAGSVILAVLLGVTLAFAVSRAPLSWQRWLGVIPLLPLVVPGVAETVGWIFLLSPRAGYLNAVLRAIFPWMQGETSGPIDVFAFEWIVILTGFSFTGFVYLYVSSSLAVIGVELEGAARVSGASQIRAFFTVTLPLIRPAIVYSSGVVFLLGLGQFTNPLLLGTPKSIHVLTTVLYETKAAYPIDYSLGAAVSAPLIIAGLSVMLLQRRTLGNVAKYTVTTGKSNERIGRGTRTAAIPVVAFGVVAVFLPISALVLVALSPYWSANFSFAAITFQHVHAILENPRTVAAIGTTVQAILLTLVIVVPLGLISSLLQRGSVRTSRAEKIITDLLTTLPLSMPAAILGFAMLYTYANPPFSLYGTVAIFVLAYLVLMLPHATRPQLSAMLSVGKEFAEASLVSGASRFRTVLTIELPMARRGVSVAVTMVIILLFHEFAASLMISTAGTETVGNLLYFYYVGGIYPQVAVLALLMVVVTLIGVVLSMAIGGRKVLAR